MLYATKIHMRPGCERPSHCAEIDTIYLEGSGANQFYKKEVLHDQLKASPHTIRVKRGAQPFLLPASNQGTKYVRTAPNDTPADDLLQLPHV